ncbi:MAG TPA: (Fe-S)-binding protein [Micromonosporaceae bacterium]|jgi:glycolate oxidase iron-sulfur subunit
MDDLRALTDACVHCGFCLPSCPTYQLTGEEAQSPRGRIHLLRQLLDGDATADDIAAPIDSCLGCLACVPACPSGVQYEPIIEAAREIVVDARPARERAARRTLFSVLPYPWRLRMAPVPLRIAPQLARVDPTLRAAAELAPPRSGHVRSLPPLVKARGPRRAVVGLLTGCAQSVFFRHVSAATARVLALEGCDVVVPRSQGCCGALSMHAGRTAQARRLARDVVATFTKANVDYLITDVAGCGSAMKGYARLLADDPRWARPAAELAAKVRDVTEFLGAIEPVAERHPVPVTVVYHDACHLANGQGVKSAPRRLLAGIPELTVVELADGGRCCGSAGTYNLFEPAMAAELGAMKAEAIVATDATVAAAGNAGCLLQIESALRQRGSSITARHTIEILDASLWPRRD